MTYALKGRFPSKMMYRHTWHMIAVAAFIAWVVGMAMPDISADGWLGVLILSFVNIGWLVGFASIFLVKNHPCGDCETCWDGRQMSCLSPIRWLQYRKRRKIAIRQAAGGAE